jgi:hypothetical protein
VRAVFRKEHAERGPKLAQSEADLVVMGDDLVDFMAPRVQQAVFLVHHPVFAAEAALIPILD